MAFPAKHASTTDSLDMCHSESGLGRRLLREENSWCGVCNAALDKMIHAENEISASLTLLLTGLPPQESSWTFAKHIWWQLLTCCPSCLIPFCLAKLRNMEQLWITVFKWYVLLETAHWLKHTLWTITLSGVRKVLKGSWVNQYLK